MKSWCAPVDAEQEDQFYRYIESRSASRMTEIDCRIHRALSLNLHDFNHLICSAIMVLRCAPALFPDAAGRYRLSHLARDLMLILIPTFKSITEEIEMRASLHCKLSELS